MSWDRARSFELQIDVQRLIESSRRFTLESSSRRWSKTETGETVGRVCQLNRSSRDEGKLTENNGVHVIEVRKPCMPLEHLSVN
jgi:hypothetical protein